MGVVWYTLLKTFVRFRHIYHLADNRSRIVINALSLTLHNNSN